MLFPLPLSKGMAEFVNGGQTEGHVLSLVAVANAANGQGPRGSSLLLQKNGNCTVRPCRLRHEPADDTTFASGAAGGTRHKTAPKVDKAGAGKTMRAIVLCRDWWWPAQQRR